MAASNKIIPSGGYNNVAMEYLTPQTSSKTIEVSNDENYPSSGSLIARFDGANSQFDCNAFGTMSGSDLTFTGNIIPEANATRSLGSSSRYYLASYVKFMSGDINSGASAAGSSISDATQLGTWYSQVTSGTASQGVKLSTSAPVGGTQVVRNNVSANSIKVYPPDGSTTFTIWGVTLSAGAAIDLPFGVTLECRKITSTAWHVTMENDRNTLVHVGTTSGSSGAYVATSNRFIGTLYAGLAITLIANHTNSGASTLNLDSTGAVAIRTKRDGSVALGSNAMLANGVYELVYDGSVWRLMSDDEGIKSWSPSYTGSGSLTYTLVTTQVGQYRRIGNLCYWWLRATGTVGGTGTSINVSAPEGISVLNGDVAMATILTDGTTVAGYFSYNSTANTIVFTRLDAANWGTGSGRLVFAMGVFEVD